MESTVRLRENETAKPEVKSNRMSMTELQALVEKSMAENLAEVRSMVQRGKTMPSS